MADTSTNRVRFPSTRWSVVLAAGQAGSPRAAEALETLCRAYWYPLYASVRRRGYSPHDAQDLTQGFFAHLLRGRALPAVAPGRGKFRSFLLTSLNHFLADEHARQQAQKRGGGRQIVSFDAQAAEQRYQLEPLSTETPEKLFERRWAMTLLDGALRRLQQGYEAAGNGALFEHLRGFVVEGAEGQPYAQVAQQFRMTEEAVKKAVQRLRRRYRQVIREEIAHTVTTASEVEEELRHLVLVLGS